MWVSFCPPPDPTFTHDMTSLPRWTIPHPCLPVGPSVRPALLGVPLPRPYQGALSSSPPQPPAVSDLFDNNFSGLPCLRFGMYSNSNLLIADAVSLGNKFVLLVSPACVGRFGYSSIQLMSHRHYTAADAKAKASSPFGFPSLPNPQRRHDPPTTQIGFQKFKFLVVLNNTI